MNTSTFRALHAQGTFLLPNPWDVGSAKLLEAAGFQALATTSSGLAAALGKQDQTVTRDELVAHVCALTAAVTVPVNVDAERCFAAETTGIAETVELLADAGAAGISIEDFDPASDSIEPIEVAAERVAAAADACTRHGLLLTARAENHLYGRDDLDDTVTRLTAYRDAGADCLYAPGASSPEAIIAIVAIGLPVNVLALPGAPTVAELARLGVRRVSTGGALAFAAYGAMVRAAEELRTAGTYGYVAGTLSADGRAAFT